jgi:hypothetical protein
MPPPRGSANPSERLDPAPDTSDRGFPELAATSSGGSTPGRKQVPCSTEDRQSPLSRARAPFAPVSTRHHQARRAELAAA